MSKPTYKTTADIVAEMRAIADSASAWHGGVAAATVARFADELEAAMKREKAIAEADALAVGGMVEATRRSAATRRSEDVSILIQSVNMKGEKQNG